MTILMDEATLAYLNQEIQRYEDAHGAVSSSSGMNGNPGDCSGCSSSCFAGCDSGCSGNCVNACGGGI